MKRLFTILMFVLFSFWANAQLELPVYFEELQEDTNWVQFANAGDAAENFIQVENPDKYGINPSDFCIQFTVLENADPWVGAYSDAYGEIAITDENYMLQMMVYKNVISDCDLKLELEGDTYEVKVPNTETDKWELLSFDFSGVSGNTYTRLVFFPDFPETRFEGSLCYIDNIGFEGTFDFGTSIKHQILGNYKIYPNPAVKNLVVQYEGMIELNVTNLAGQQLKSHQCMNSNYEILDVSDLAKGIYFVTLISAKGTVSSKFVKE
jgi:hypothetical protein